MFAHPPRPARRPGRGRARRVRGRATTPSCPPRPTRCRRAAEALEQVARSGQVGRVVLDLRRRRAARCCPRRRRLPGGPPPPTYLVTGGFGDFGLATARWLVESGARHLALVGRRGAHHRRGARPSSRAFAEAGVEVLRAGRGRRLGRRGDRDARRQVGATMPPLRGVFHAAGRARRPAVHRDRRGVAARPSGPEGRRGALNLHRATAEPRARPLRAVLLGLGDHRQRPADHLLRGQHGARLAGRAAPGRGPAGADGELGLAGRRHGRVVGGRPALPGDDRPGADRPRTWPRAALGECLAVGVAHAGVLDLDWARWGATHPLSSSTARFTEHVAAGRHAAPQVGPRPARRAGQAARGAAGRGAGLRAGRAALRGARASRPTRSTWPPRCPSSAWTR